MLQFHLSLQKQVFLGKLGKESFLPFLLQMENHQFLYTYQYYAVVIISVFLKVDVSCNGEHPVRILESKLKPSKIYAVENSSAVEEWDLVKNLKRHTIVIPLV